jgi:hypothetical protein
MKSYVFLFLLCLSTSPLFSQEVPNPQSLLEKWDSVFNLEEGMYEIQIQGEPPASKEINGFLYVNSLQDRHFSLSTPDGVPIQKFIYQEALRSSHLSHPNQSLIIQLTEMESMKREIPSTSFSYYDISGFFLEKNFLVERIEPYTSSEKKYWKLILSPIKKNYYQKLYVYIEQETKLPYRIDYLNPEGLLIKILRVRMGKISVQSKEKKESKEMMTEFEMTRMSDSKKSYFRFITLRTYPSVDPGLFTIRSIR